jgi:hypothetical protein
MTELPPDTPPVRPAPRGRPSPRGRRPGPGAVIWGSIALFAALFAFLTYQLGSTSGVASSPVTVRKIVKRRVVTTILPTPGASSVTSGPVTSSYSGGAAPLVTGAS